MSAEALGEELLREVKEEGLHEVCIISYLYIHLDEGIVFFQKIFIIIIVVVVIAFFGCYFIFVIVFSFPKMRAPN